MSDLIDRREALRALKKEIDYLGPPYVDDEMRGMRFGLRLARNIIEDLPIIESKENKGGEE